MNRNLYESRDWIHWNPKFKQAPQVILMHEKAEESLACLASVMHKVLHPSSDDIISRLMPTLALSAFCGCPGVYGAKM